MSVFIGGISCEEMGDGFEEGVREGGPYAVKKYQCAWADRYAVANGLLGLVSGSGGSSPAVNLTTPQQYPESRNMWAREISIKGAGVPTQGAAQVQFVKAIITVNYGVPQFGYLSYPDQSLDPTAPYVWATQEIDVGRQMLTIENSTLVLANGKWLDSSHNYAVPIPTVVMSITLHKVPYLPAAQIIKAVQKPLNSTTYLGVDPGYLMFNGARSRMEASTDGTYAQELTLNFAYRPILRWDEIFDPRGVDGPQQVREISTGLAVLQRSDLSTLIPSAYQG